MTQTYDHDSEISVGPIDWRATILPDVLVLIVLIATNLVAVLARHFPFQDAPNHLARYVLIDRILSGSPVYGYEFHWQLTPYIGLDLVGAGLVHLFGAPIAEKALSLLALSLPMIGMYALLRAVAPSRRYWAVVGVPLVFSWFTLAGLLNFMISFGLSLSCLAWYWPRRQRRGLKVALIMAAWAMAIFFVHLAGSLIVLGYLSILIFVEVMDFSPLTLREPRDFFRRPEVITGCAVLATVAILAGLSSFLTGTVGSDGQPIFFRPVTNKIMALGAPFYTFSLATDGIIAIGYIMLVCLYFFRYAAEIHRDTFFWSALLFLLLFFASPDKAAGATGIDVRWLLAAYVLPFCTVSKSRPREHFVIPLFLLFFAAADLTLNHLRINRIDHLLDDYDTVLASIPPSKSVLSVVSTKSSYPRVTPYEQYASWYVIRQSGYVPGLWSYNSGALPPHPHLRHFSATIDPYDPQQPPIDWSRVANDFDYVLVVSESSALREQAKQMGREIISRGPISLMESRGPSTN